MLRITTHFSLILSLISVFFVLLSSFTCIPFKNSVTKNSMPPALEWPAYRPAYPAIPYLSSTFGESRYDHFHNGLDLAGLGIAIYPIARGTLLYRYYKHDDPYEAERGPGNALFLDHGQGWWSGYYHLLDEKKTMAKEEWDTTEVIARMGNTGRSSGSHLHFYLIGSYGKKLVNPLKHLPPIQDPNPPKIKALLIITPESQTRLETGKEHLIRLTSKYPLYLEVEDPGKEKKSRRGIYQLTWQINKAKKKKLRFDELFYKAGDWYLEDLSCAQVFHKQLYYLGEPHFYQGLNQIKVEVQDYNGNKSQTLFKIRVARQY